MSYKQKTLEDLWHTCSVPLCSSLCRASQGLASATHWTISFPSPVYAGRAEPEDREGGWCFGRGSGTAFPNYKEKELDPRHTCKSPLSLLRQMVLFRPWSSPLLPNRRSVLTILKKSLRSCPFAVKLLGLTSGREWLAAPSNFLLVTALEQGPSANPGCSGCVEVLLHVSWRDELRQVHGGTNCLPHLC